MNRRTCFVKFCLMVWCTGVGTLNFASADETPTGSELVWNRFRGPDGMGQAASPNVTTQIDLKSNLRWRTTTKGIGWSSPVTDGKTFWMTSSMTTKATPEQRRNKLAGVQFSQMKEVAGSVELFALAIDAESGKILVERSLGTVDDPNPIHPMNSYASPTPALASGRVVCHFGSYGTHCLDVSTGETLWTERLIVDDSVGPGSSPAIVGDKVLLVCDGIDQQFIAALSLADGKLLWKTPRPAMRSSNGEFQKAYSSPLIIDVDGQQQAVIPGAQWIVAYDPETGKEIWRADHGDGFSTTPMAIYAAGLIVFSTGYTSPELIALDPTGTGDVTSTHVRWRQRSGVPAKPSPISDGKRVYLISDDGILSAVSLSDGASLWRKRIGGTFSSSPLISGKNIFIGNHDGDVTVFQAGDEYREVSRTDLGEQVMASPVPFGNDLIIRTKSALYRFAGN